MFRWICAAGSRVGLSGWFLDDREEYANTQRFPVCETMVWRILGTPPIFLSSENVSVIVTRGQAHDRVSLQWALGKKPKYTA
jgi:xanthine dehydrogenase accessory factor